MCAIIGTIVAVGFALIIDNLKAFITLPSIVAYIIISFAISYVLTLKYAPKDSPNKPIDKDSKIIELKLKSIRMLHTYFIICIFILALSIYLNNQNLLPYIALICSGHLWQAITITSLGIILYI